MSTKTQSELVDQVLENLGVLGEGQTSELDQIQRVNDRLPGVIETLRSTEVFYLGDLEAIPLEAFVPLSDVVAWECRSKFGVTGDDLVVLESAYERAIRMLRVMTRGRPTYAVLATEYF